MSEAKRVALLDLFARADGFIGDSSLGALGGRLRAEGHQVDLVRSVLAEDGRGDVVAWHAEIADFVRRGHFDYVVLPRAWDAATLAALRNAMGEGATLVRLTNGVAARLDEHFDRVLDEPGLVALLGGAAEVPNAAWKKTSARELRRLAVVATAQTIAPTPLAGQPNEPVMSGGRPTLSGPASGCPFLLDAAKNPIFARAAIDPDKVQMKGCTFCLDNTGAFAVPSEAAVLESWLGQLRRARAHLPEAREFLLTDERPHPYLPAFFRAVRDEGLGPLELLIKSRVDWLLEFADTALSEAAALAEASGSVLHVYLVGFESFDPFHLQLFNKGSTVDDNLAAIEALRALGARYPRSFEYLRFRAHGIVVFTPWTRPEHLLENARGMRAARFHELRSEAVRTRLRLYPRVPLHALALADGLVVDHFDEGRGDRAAEQGYDASVPWRFQDGRMEAVYRVATALASYDRSLRDADVLEAAAHFVLKWPGLAAVPDDAFLPMEQALRVWAPGSGAGPAAASSGFDPEVDLIAAGHKQGCLKEGVPSAKAAGLVRAYRAMGLAAEVVERHGLDAASDTHGQGDAFAIVAVARDEATLAAVLEAQRRHKARSRDGGPDPVAAMGALMGYPACCVAAFAAQQERGDNLENERLTLRRNPRAALHPLLNRLAQVRLISHHLCAADCAASLAIAEAVLTRLAATAPEAAAWVRQELGAPVLCLDYERRIRLEGHFAGDAFVVQSAAPIGSFRGARDQELPFAEIAHIALSPRGAAIELKDGRRLAISARAPLLVTPGAPLAPAALAAIGGPLAASGATPAPEKRALAPLPAAFRPGVRVLAYRILAVRSEPFDYGLTLGNGPHRFDVHLWSDDPSRRHLVRRGRWFVDVDAPDALPEPARAALSAVIRALPA